MPGSARRSAAEPIDVCSDLAVLLRPSFLYRLPTKAFRYGPGRDRTCDLGIKVPKENIDLQLGANAASGRMARGATVSIVFRRQARARARSYGRPLALVIVSACALSIPTISGGETGPSSGAFLSAARVKPKRLLLVKDLGIEAIAEAGRYLTWEEGAFSPRARGKSPVLERDRLTGKTRILATDSFPQFGLAATTGWVVYARSVASGITLLAVRHGGGNRTVLTRTLVAPIASRGNRVAWAEQWGPLQRVIVRDMNNGHNWIAARVPRCHLGRCYRIDAVTLADDGVVFDRGAVGPQPSLMVRRGFHDSKPTTIRVRNDPQPELAPSSAGGLYYWLQHGWRRWDFGQRRPGFTRLHGVQWWVLAYERGRFLLVSRDSRCRPRTILQLPSGQRIPLPAPTSTPASPREFGRLCRLMTGVAWRGKRLLIAWSVLPAVSLRAHADVGVVGVIMSTKTP